MKTAAGDQGQPVSMLADLARYRPNEVEQEQIEHYGERTREPGHPRKEAR
jgi:hypothetical protein